ncbi:MAG TPA: hypothetical protein VNK23_06995 [Candidatus Dormibacteraeota bacterium]|nr:hypothetical protein [Candidatus Dormibacteraeota bacterium]
MTVSGKVVSVSAVFLAFVLFAPLSARAQMRMGAAHPMNAMRTHPGATHFVRAQRAPVAAAAPRQFHRSNIGVPPVSFGNAYAGGSGESLGQLLNPVPGLGFDYSHLNAINSDLGIEAVIDPETEWRLAVAERVARTSSGFGAGGYYLLDGGGDYILPAEPAADQPSESSQPGQPTVIVLQEQAKPQPAADEAPAVAPQPATPLPNVSNFTLVLQNGTKIQAIAFTRMGDKIVYIAADGSRHTISASELNPSATEQLNAASGMQLRF